MLADIQGRVPLGRATLSPVLEALNKIGSPASIPSEAQGFFFFYSGLDAFEKTDLSGAVAHFNRVPSHSRTYPLAQYYLGLGNTLQGRLPEAINNFDRSYQASQGKGEVGQLSVMAKARIYYEQSKMADALNTWAKIPRNSPLWVQSLFEGSWAFFTIQKHNNALGNLHTVLSPFFENRFFPEVYILQAIIYLNLCYDDRVALSLRKFVERYSGSVRDLNGLLRQYKGQSGNYFKFVTNYARSKTLSEFRGALPMVDSVSRSEAFRESYRVMQGLSRENSMVKARLQEVWRNSGLAAALTQSYEERQKIVGVQAGKTLFMQTVDQAKYLSDLVDQTKLISVQRSVQATDQLRSELEKVPQSKKDEVWGEGMKPLDLSREIEYWPFEGEYWEDELGGYVYNIPSQCGVSKEQKK